MEEQVRGKDNGNNKKKKKPKKKESGRTKRKSLEVELVKETQKKDKAF